MLQAAAIARAKVQKWDCTQCVLETETSWLEHGFAYGSGGKQRQGGGLECSPTVHQRFAHKCLLMIGLKVHANGTLRFFWKITRLRFSGTGLGKERNQSILIM